MVKPNRSKTFRVFVSSTFSDLAEERNALQNRVWPELQKLCEKDGFRFQAIDLRWGIPAEAGLDQRTAKICLDEVERCQKASPRPNFIILLGNRYGWRPLPSEIMADEFASILAAAENLQAQAAMSDSQLAEEIEYGLGLLNDWYRLDNNACPPSYYIRARAVDAHRAEDRSWRNVVERPLRKLLLDCIDSIWHKDDPRRANYEQSLTEQEIMAGALHPTVPDASEHVFAYFREVEVLNELTYVRDERDLYHLRKYVDFVDGTPYCDLEARKRQQNLKHRIELTLGKDHVRRYQESWTGCGVSSLYLKQLCDDIYNDLRTIIEAEIEEYEKNYNALDAEIAAHAGFAEKHGTPDDGLFLGRTEELARIENYLSSPDSNRPLLITGPSGSGKSSLLACAALDPNQKHAQALKVLRFIGVTPGSTRSATLLSSICEQLNKSLATADPAKEENGDTLEYGTLIGTFRQCLESATAERPIHLYLDAVDQLSRTDDSHVIDWIPPSLPRHVRVVLSILDDSLADDDKDSTSFRSPDDTGTLEKLSEFAGKGEVIRIPDYSPKDAAELVDSWLRGAGRKLTEEQKKDALDAFASCPRPLFLKLVVEEAKLWRSDEERVPLPRSNTHEGSLSLIVHRLFDRLSDAANHGELFVSRAIGFLVASRDGLAEGELLKLLSDDGAFMKEFKHQTAKVNQPLPPGVDSLPVAVWIRLYSELLPYLTTHPSEGPELIAFYHRSLERAARTRFLGSNSAAALRHVELAKLFQERLSTLNDVRALRELAYHYCLAQDTKSLYRLARDNNFLRQQFAIKSAGQSIALETLQLAMSLAVDCGDADPMVEFMLKPRRVLQFVEASREVRQPWTEMKERGIHSAIQLTYELSDNEAFQWLILMAWELSSGTNKEASKIPLARARKLQSPRCELNSRQWPSPPLGDDHPADDCPGSGEWYAYAFSELVAIDEAVILELQRRAFDDPLRALLAERLIAGGHRSVAEQLLNDVESVAGEIELRCVLSNESTASSRWLAPVASLLKPLTDIAEFASTYRRYALTCLELGLWDRFHQVLSQVRDIQVLRPGIEIGSRTLVNLEAELLFPLLSRQLLDPSDAGPPEPTAFRLLELANSEQLPEGRQYFQNNEDVPLLWSWIHNRLASCVLKADKSALVEAIHERLPLSHFRDHWRMLDIAARARRSGATSDVALAPFMQEALNISERQFQGTALGELALLHDDVELRESLLEVSSLVSASGNPYGECNPGKMLTRAAAAWECGRRQTVIQFARANCFEQALHFATEIRGREHSSITNLGGPDEWKVSSRLEGEKWQYHASLRDLVQHYPPSRTPSWLEFVRTTVRYPEHRQWIAAKEISKQLCAHDYTAARMLLAQCTVINTARQIDSTLPPTPSRIVPEFPSHEVSGTLLQRHIRTCDHLLNWKNEVWPWYKSQPWRMVNELLRSFRWPPKNVWQALYDIWYLFVTATATCTVALYLTLLVMLVLSAFSGNVPSLLLIAAIAIAAKYFPRKMLPTEPFRAETLRKKYELLFGEEFFMPGLSRVSELYRTELPPERLQLFRDMNEIDEQHVQSIRHSYHGNALSDLIQQEVSTFENDTLLHIAIRSLRSSPTPGAVAAIQGIAGREAQFISGDNTIGIGGRSVDARRPAANHGLCNAATLALSSSLARHGAPLQAIDVLELLLPGNSDTNVGISGKMACAFQCAIRHDFDGIRYVVESEIRHYAGTETTFTQVVPANMPPLSSVVREIVASLSEQGLMPIARDLANHFDMGELTIGEPVTAKRLREYQPVGNRHESNSPTDEQVREVFKRILQKGPGATPEERETWMIFSVLHRQRSGPSSVSFQSSSPSEFVKAFLQTLDLPFLDDAPLHEQGFAIATIIQEPSYSIYARRDPSVRKAVQRLRLVICLWQTNEPDLCVELLRRGDFEGIADDAFETFSRSVPTQHHLEMLLEVLGSTRRLKLESTRLYLETAESGMLPELFRRHVKYLAQRSRNDRAQIYALLNAISSSNEFGDSKFVADMAEALFREREQERRQDIFLREASSEPIRADLANLNLLEPIADIEVECALTLEGAGVEIASKYETTLAELHEHCRNTEVQFGPSAGTWARILIDHAATQLRYGFPEFALRIIKGPIEDACEGRPNYIPATGVYGEAIAIKAEAHFAQFQGDHALHGELIEAASASSAALRWCHRYRCHGRRGKDVDEYLAKATYILSRCLDAAGLREDALKRWDPPVFSRFVRNDGLDYLACLFQQCGQLSEAIERCQWQINHNPYNALTRCRRIELLLKLERVPEALKLVSSERLDFFPVAERGLFRLLSAIVQIKSGTFDRRQFRLVPQVSTENPRVRCLEYDFTDIVATIDKVESDHETAFLHELLSQVKPYFAAPLRATQTAELKETQKKLKAMIH